jgi:hypothetical protein
MNTHKLTTRDQTTEFLLYTAPNGGIKVEVLISHEMALVEGYPHCPPKVVMA